MTSSIYGVRETLAELRELDKAAQLACVREMKKAAQPLANKVGSYLPTTPPLSGFDHLGRTGWNRAECWQVGIKYGGRKRKDKNEWALLSLRLEAGPTIIFDMAGRKASNPLASQLSKRYGSASRAAWRPEAEMMRQSAEAIERAVEEASNKVNAKLVKRPGGIT